MEAVALVGSLAGCAVMVGAAVLTGWRIDAASRRGGRADDYFWIVFGGVVVVVGAGVVAGSLGAAWAAVTVGITSSAAASAWAWRRHEQRSRLAEEASRAAAWSDLQRRHEGVVRRWAEYDVDPGKAIDYPGMHDPRNPAVRSVVHALRAAEAECGVGSAALAHGDAGTRRYADAVAGLEQAFDAAEHELEEPETRRPPRHRAVPGRP